MNGLGGIPQDGDRKKYVCENTKESTYHIMKEREVEFQRRTNVFDQSDPARDAPVASSTRKATLADVIIPEQQLVLFNIAHKNQCPRNSRPAYRILGFFENKKTMKKHAEMILKATDDKSRCNMHMAEVGKKVVLCESLKRQTDQKYVSTKTKLISEKYLDDDQHRKKEFDANKANQRVGVAGQSILHRRHDKATARRRALEAYAQIQQHKVPEPLLKGPPQQTQTTLPMIQTAETTEEAKNEPDVVAVSHTVLGQTFAVMSCIPDNTPGAMKGRSLPEPIVIFWRAFGSEKEAMDWVLGVGSKAITHVDLDVVECYQWQFPEDVDREKIKEGFRTKELQNVMNQKKAGHEEVADFERWCDSEKIKPPTTEFVLNPDTKEATTVTATEHVAELTAYEKLLPTDKDFQPLRRRKIKADKTIKVSTSKRPAGIFETDSVPQNLLAPEKTTNDGKSKQKDGRRIRRR